MGQNQGFNKQQRLLTASDYSAVFKVADYKVSSSTLLVLAKKSECKQARLGLVISKKNVGCSVKRNRIKRLFREVFRRRAKELAVVDIVLLARPGLSLKSNEEIILMLNSLLGELNTRISRVKS